MLFEGGQGRNLCVYALCTSSVDPSFVWGAEEQEAGSEPTTTEQKRFVENGRPTATKRDRNIKGWGGVIKGKEGGCAFAGLLGGSGCGPSVPLHGPGAPLPSSPPPGAHTRCPNTKAKSKGARGGDLFVACIGSRQKKKERKKQEAKQTNADAPPASTLLGRLAGRHVRACWRPPAVVDAAACSCSRR